MSAQITVLDKYVEIAPGVFKVCGDCTIEEIKAAKRIARKHAKEAQAEADRWRHTLTVLEAARKA